jgi:hypothetical protein
MTGKSFSLAIHGCAKVLIFEKFGIMAVLAIRVSISKNPCRWVNVCTKWEKGRF